MAIVAALTQAKAQAKSSEPGAAFRQYQQTAQRAHTSAAVTNFPTNDGKNNWMTEGSAP
jgi:hypothetical protein